MKLLVAQDAGVKTASIYNAPEYLRIRHHLPEELIVNIASIAEAAE